MNHCTHCGAPLQTGQAFCTRCGARTASQSPAAPAPAPQSSPLPAAPAPDGSPTPPTPSPSDGAQAGASVPPAPAYRLPAESTPAVPADATATPNHRRRLAIVIVAALAVLAIVIGGGCFWAYRAEVVGGRTVHTAAQLRGDGMAHLTADTVVHDLKSRGFTSVTKIEEFSGNRRGEFMRYEGVQEGTRTSTDTPITVVESAGPGVPEGTVGLSEDDAVARVANMDVPVSRAQVVVSSAAHAEPGAVVMTAPADGTALQDADTDRGIVLGVASDGAGVGIDLVGQDKDTVRKTLEADGFTVTMKPRFSSERYLGKMVTSDPQPGIATSSRSVTVYYGVGADDVRDVFTMNTKNDPDGWVAFPGDALSGRYCKADGTDCLEFAMEDATAWRSSEETDGQALYETSDRDKRYQVNQYSTSVAHRYLTSSPGMGTIPLKAPGQETSAARLLDTDTGVFDLYPHSTYYSSYCGDQEWNVADSYVPLQLSSARNDTIPSGLGGVTGTTYCKSGHWTSFMPGEESGDDRNWRQIDESEYRMDNYYIYYPVGADGDAVEQLGLYDHDAVALAQSQEQVDVTRPFVVKRDASLYDESERARRVQDVEAQVGASPFGNKNPFAALLLNDDGTKLRSDKVAVKPAPSNETVYYLDEDSLIGDWTDDAERIDLGVDGDDGGKDAGANNTTGTKNAQEKEATMELRPWTDVRKELMAGDFTQAEGTYCQASGECLTMDADGSLVLGDHEAHMSYDADQEDRESLYSNLKESTDTWCDTEAAKGDPRMEGQEPGYCPSEYRYATSTMFYYPGGNPTMLAEYQRGIEGTIENRPFLNIAPYPACTLDAKYIYYLRE